MWISNSDDLPPHHYLLRNLGYVEATVLIALTTPGNADCRQGWQAFLDQLPVEANLVRRFRVESAMLIEADGPVLRVTFKGLAGIGCYKKR